MSAYFITGTGTEVGKTFTTCALIHAAQANGIAVRGLKPVLSGWVVDDSTNDVAQILTAQGGGTVDAVSYCRFTAPLSPHRAAALEGKAIDPETLVNWCRSRVSNDGLTLIEGAGGVMAPLTERYTVLDWMQALNLPVILVTGSYLGSISHTLTALEALRGRNLTVAALVINESVGGDVTLAEAEAGLSPFIQHLPLRIVQPRVSSWKEAQAIHALMEKL